jgi:hypothetical protein
VQQHHPIATWAGISEAGPIRVDRYALQVSHRQYWRRRSHCVLMACGHLSLFTRTNQEAGFRYVNAYFSRSSSIIAIGQNFS